MSNYNTQLQYNNTDLQAILNAIDELPEAGGTTLPTLTNPAKAADILSGKEAVDANGNKITGTITTVAQATPSITVDANGLIKATATQTAGYTAGGTQSATKQLAFQAAKTITPGTTNQTAIAAGYYAGGNIIVEGDSDLVAENIVQGKTIFGVTGTATTGGGGDTSIEDGLITNTLTTYTNNRVTTITSYAFYFLSNLITISFPNVTHINNDAFACCSSLTSISFPKATIISRYAFASCYSLVSVNFPLVSQIKGYAFAYCSSLTSVNFPLVKEVGSFAFYNCSNLTTIDFPIAYLLESSIFQSCKNLTFVNIPAVQSIGTNTFRDCIKLTSVNIASATRISASAFYGCSNLTSISLPVTTIIGSSAFYSCTMLSQIYLLASSVCTLSNRNAFSNTAIGSNKGSIFVPTSLVNAYKSATNWTYFSNRIFGV